MENDNQQEQQTDAQNNRPDIQQRPVEKIIQPLTKNQENNIQPDQSASDAPKIDTSSIYPEATADASPTKMNTSQAFAINTMQSKSKETNRQICLRVKSVLAIGVVLMFSSIFYIVASIGVPYGTVLIILSLIQLLMAVGLLTSKDHNTVSLILKIFLIFQVLTLLLSLANPSGIIVSGIGLVLLFYAYYRVKSLAYY